MTHETEPASRQVRKRPPFDCIALVLQGGGALGAYQAGVFEALAEGGIEPDWIAGISIGAFNSAIIAGNPPEKRVEKLRQFWESITEPYVEWKAPFAWPGASPEALPAAAPKLPDFWQFASGLAPALKGDTVCDAADDPSEDAVGDRADDPGDDDGAGIGLASDRGPLGGVDAPNMTLPGCDPRLPNG